MNTINRFIEVTKTEYVQAKVNTWFDKFEAYKSEGWTGICRQTVQHMLNDEDVASFVTDEMKSYL